MPAAAIHTHTTHAQHVMIAANKHQRCCLSQLVFHALDVRSSTMDGVSYVRESSVAMLGRAHVMMVSRGQSGKPITQCKLMGLMGSLYF